MAPVPSHVSNHPIPDAVYALPPNLQPQPALTRFWCKGCVSSLTTTSKGAPNGTVGSFREVFLREEGYCTRRGNIGVCSGCSASKQGGCVEIPPEFRRAVNVLDYLIEHALRKEVAFDTAALSADDARVVQQAQKYWERAHEYAGHCRAAFASSDAERKRLVKDSGLDPVAFSHARQASKEHNLARYTAGIGTTGLKQPVNVVVDLKVEAHFEKTGGAAPKEKRWFYYGTDIPDARAPLPLTPRKRVQTSFDEMELSV